MTHRLIRSFLLLSLLPCLQGCLTPALWEGYMGVADDRVEVEVPAVRPQRLVRAARSPDQLYVFEVRYTDGSLRWLEYQAPPPAEWPAAETAADLPELATWEGERFPRPCEGWTPVEVDPVADHRDEAQAVGQLRLCRGRLEFRVGDGPYRLVAHFPWERATTKYVDEGPGVGTVALGALVVLATPIAAGLDVAGFATLFGLAFV